MLSASSLFLMLSSSIKQLIILTPMQCFSFIDYNMLTQLRPFDTGEKPRKVKPTLDLLTHAAGWVARGWRILLVFLLWCAGKGLN